MICRQHCLNSFALSQDKKKKEKKRISVPGDWFPLSGIIRYLVLLEVLGYRPMLDNPSIPKSFHCKHNLWVTKSVLGICQHLGLKLVKQFLQLPLDVNGLKAHMLGKAGDAESAVKKQYALILRQNHFCFPLGSPSWNPPWVTPASKELVLTHCPSHLLPNIAS